MSAPFLRRPGNWLVVVAVVHAVLPLVILGLRWPFGADESVYLSQYNAHLPALYFSAPRARGPALIAAPVTLLTSSVAAVRVWVTVLSGIGLWAAFRPWLTVVRCPVVVPAAAAAFASLWTVMLYGPEVMPNEWVAFATLGAAGLFARWLDLRRRRELLGVVAAVALVGLLRPSDAAYAVLGLGLPVLLLRRPWRVRLVALGALVTGLLLGVAQWVVEAQTSYGGVLPRVHAAQAEQGGSGLFWAGGAQARVLAGPLLCRAGCHADAAVAYRLWWLVAAVLVVLGVVDAVRRRASAVLVLVSAGAVVAAQYLFTVPYAAPRFLLPAYALLAIPAMVGARSLARSVHRVRVRRAVIAGLVLACAANAVVQLEVLTAHLLPATYASADRTAGEVRALRRAGVHAPCVVIGHPSNDLQLSYSLGCTNGPVGTRTLRAAAPAERIVRVGADAPDVPAATAWTRVALPGSSSAAWVAAMVRT